MFNLQEATADHHAISWGWVKDNTVLKSGNNTVSNGWKIQSDQKSHFHVEGGETKIYWLQDPSHAQHPVTMGWADNKYAQASNLSSYLPVAGGTLTGNLQFSGGARIDCNNGNTVLHSTVVALSFGLLPTSRSSLVLVAAPTGCFRSTASTAGQQTKGVKKRISPLEVKLDLKVSIPTARN